MLIGHMPDNVVPIVSGLFEILPNNLIVLPVLFEGQVKAVIELASVGSFTDLQISFLEQLTDSIGIVLNSETSARKSASGRLVLNPAS